MLKRSRSLGTTRSSRRRSAKPAKTRHDLSEFGVAPVPRTKKLETVRKAALGCRACPLWKLGTCTVFGEGSAEARILLVGEQPGDAEDRAGRPFVGPAGRMLDKAMEEAGIDPAACYKTNAVKHFKWEPRGERRMHKTPTEREIAACRPWLDAELQIIRPELVVCLGSSAAFSVFGKRVKVLENRGKFIEMNGRRAMLTVHPSMLLRIPDRQARHEAYEQFVSDLRTIGRSG